MRALLIASAFAAALMLGACGNDRETEDTVGATQPAEPSQEIFAIGSALTDTGAVTADSTSDQYQRGPELYVSVNVTSASTEQTIEVEWFDAQGSVVRTDRRRVPPGNGHATFSSGPTKTWKRGPHRAVIVIDGRKVSEKQFSLI